MSNIDLARLFLGIATLLGAALAGGVILAQLRLPRVIGEIMGGLVLGPTVLGYFIPEAFEWLFQSGKHQNSALEMLYWLGLILLMFVSGFRIQQHLSTEDGKEILAILAAATIPPFILGWNAVDLFDLSGYLGRNGNPLAFQIVVAIAVTVTSIPVISKIFIDLELMGTRFAKIVLGCATLQDVMLWAALGVATGIAAEGMTASADSWDIAAKVGVALGFLAIALVVIRAAMLRTARALPIGAGRGASATGIVLGVCFVFSALAAALGVNIVFGALVAGIVIGSMPQASFERIKDGIAEVSLAFFVPVYFALVGLKLDLINYFEPAFTLLFIAGSTAIVIIPVLVTGLLLGKSLLTSINLGMAMNTRGGPGIVLASVALAAGIIEESFFVTLVISAVVTSALSGAWFHWVKARGLPLYNSRWNKCAGYGMSANEKLPPQGNSTPADKRGKPSLAK